MRFELAEHGGRLGELAISLLAGAGFGPSPRCWSCFRGSVRHHFGPAFLALLRQHLLHQFAAILDRRTQIDQTGRQRTHFSIQDLQKLS